MLSAVIGILLVQATALDDPPKPKQPPTAKQLAAIAARGRLLAEYDRATWYASDEVQRHELKEGLVAPTLPTGPTRAGWSPSVGSRTKKGRS